MSGGSFDTSPYRIEDVAREIEIEIERNKIGEIGKERPIDIFYFPKEKYPENVIEKFEEAVKTLRLASKMAHRIDYLLAGDDGVETFLKTWNEEINTNGN
jgi:hypothetical protein